MEAKEIILHFDRTHFEDIYFQGDQGDYIKDPSIQKKFWMFIAYSIGFLLTILFFNSFYTKEMYTLFFIFLILLGHNYYTRFLVLKKRKHQIASFLDDLEKYDSHTLIVSDHSFSIIQDSEEVIEKWSNFTKVEIKENYISLISDEESYLIPTKSMTPSDDKIFRELVSDKVKQS